MIQRCSFDWLNRPCLNTHATLMLEAGASLKDVQERLGHSSIQMTGDIYAHVTPVMQEKSSQAFSDYLEERS
ncbi:tyrosine-type recombinase/integrase [Bacillus gobiensis]|uniref:tyrosine-type recombinase/integrase n=1 Tax=Bacillus gobiensis TaxID=1441095 RepID=UPI003D2599A3